MLITKVTKFLGALVFLVSGNTLFADFITVPNLPEGSQYRLTFVTNSSTTALSSLMSDFNTFVTTQANQNAALASLSSTWTAIGSTALVDARDNTNTNPLTSVGVPIYRLDGSLVAIDNADLWDGSLLSSISLNQNGVAMTGPVWTGTGTNGVGLNPLQLGMAETQYGIMTATNNQWVSFGSDLPDGIARVYAISATLVVPPSIPEPSSIVLVGAGVIFSAVRRQRTVRRHRRT